MKSLQAIKLWIEYLLARGYKKRTLERYESETKLFFDWINKETQCSDVREVDAQTIMRFFTFMADEKNEDGSNRFSTSTRKGFSATINGLFRFLVRQGYILSNPMHTVSFSIVRKYPLPKSIPLEKINAMLNIIDDTTFVGARDKALFECMYGTGIRVGEAIQLEVSDVDFASHTLLIREGKGRKDRMVPMGSNLIEILKSYVVYHRPTITKKLKRKKEIQAFFISTGGKRLDKSNLNRRLQLHSKKVGIPKATSHLLRHSFATHILERGAKIIQVKEILGHASLDTTTVYTNVSEQSLRRIMKKYHPRETDIYEEMSPDEKERIIRMLHNQ